MAYRRAKDQKRRYASIVSVAWLTLCPSGLSAREVVEAPIVETKAGPVRGAVFGVIRVFRGIPYAKPPVGSDRWKPPVEPSGWSGLRDATEFTPDCPGALPMPSNAAEDCLYLNVWTQAAPSAGKRPVMVWIYGGGYRGGSASIPLFDGSALTSRGVVLVSFGYRVGPLGFLATDELTAESPNKASGNYGILDAIAALHWVQANIASFGGDPDNVTIFGQSSGSETVNILTASPLAKGLFHRAIGQSGSSFGVRKALPMAVAEEAGRAFMAERKVSSLAELRALPVEEVLADNDRKYEPNVDGWLLPMEVSATYQIGRQNDVPMLIGSNGQEWGRPSELSPDEFRNELVREYGALSHSLIERLGPLENSEAATNARWALLNLEWGDFPAASWAKRQSITGQAPIFRYRFDYAPPQKGDAPPTAHHGAELPYVFGTYEDVSPGLLTETDAQLASLLGTYWVNFARMGDPNADGLPNWPRTTRAAARLMRFSADGAQLSEQKDTELLELIRRHHEERISE